MTLRDLFRTRWLLSSMLIAGAALFAIGIAAERNASAHHNETGIETANPTPATTEQPTSTGDNGGDESTHTGETSVEGTTHTEPTIGEAAGHLETTSETVLGLNLESNALVIIAVAMSLALAVLTWFRNRRSLLLATTAFALVFAVFDIAEIAHQITESRAGLATLAAAIALVHLATALVAQQRATTASPQQPAS